MKRSAFVPAGRRRHAPMTLPVLTALAVVVLPSANAAGGAVDHAGRAVLEPPATLMWNTPAIS